MADNRPNPLSKAAEASHLPRAARARIGQTTDPVPEGKVAHTEPEHHFPIEPAGHERTHSKTAEELGLEPHELEKLQRFSREHVDLKSDIWYSRVMETTHADYSAMDVGHYLLFGGPIRMALQPHDESQSRVLSTGAQILFRRQHNI